MSLENLIAAMREPDFYPDRPADVEFRQTHISCVFLAGDFVYKIKKPLHLAFLDYSTLERRFQFCQDEVRLNRRLTARVYLGVYAILRRDGRFALSAGPVEHPHPAAVEYAVKMRRLPDDRSLERLIGAGQVDAEMMRRIAHVAAKFHADAARDRSIEYGEARAIELKIATNLTECRPFVGDTIGEREFGSIERFNRTFIERHRELLNRRASLGFVREGHGDLRAEHICITDDIDIIDCVEFSEMLRYGDIASDVAFLLMDLDRLEVPALGHDLLNAYLGEIGDRELTRLLNFYKCFRAMVRGKVGSIKARASEVLPDSQRRASASARNYLAAAYEYAKVGSPVLIVVCGLPASGKSTIAQALAERSGYAAFNSDVIRKRLAGKAPTQRAGGGFGEGLYGRESTAATYQALAQAAAETLRAGDGVIIDATYNDPAQRNAIREVAREAGAPIVFVECVVSPEDAKRRLAARGRDPDAVSDATWEIYSQYKAAFKPFGPEFSDCHLIVDGAAHPADAARAIERFIARD